MNSFDAFAVCLMAAAAMIYTLPAVAARLKANSRKARETRAVLERRLRVWCG